MLDTDSSPIKAKIKPDPRYKADEDRRIELYGIAPLNPFTILRSSLSLSVNRFASVCHVDRKALSRLETGTYIQPLPSMVDYWVNRGSITEGQLLDDYEQFQFNQRRRHQLYFGDGLNANLGGVHPFIQLRNNRPSLVNGGPLPVGLTEFTEALCLPLDTIQHFEQKNPKSVPKALKMVLNQIGYGYNTIPAFERTYLEWRDLQQSKFKMPLEQRISNG